MPDMYIVPNLVYLRQYESGVSVPQQAVECGNRSRYPGKVAHQSEMAPNQFPN